MLLMLGYFFVNFVMNFLAHIYLSFDHPEVTLGNFFADHIRGNHYKHLPIPVQNGILLHREIDTFTDAHRLHKKSSKRLHQNYGHYSRVIVDIFYDHFLAKNWDNYSEVKLPIYAAQFYELLQRHYDILPDKTKYLLPYMLKDNWLVNYGNLEGISRVLNGMNRRTKNRSKMNLAILDLEQYYSEFESEFTSFFEELITFSRHKFKIICKD